MKTVYIVGGDGFARESYWVFYSVMQHDSTVRFGGFLGHGGYGHAVDYKTLQHLYKGEVADHDFADDEYVMIGAAYPDLREKIYNDLKTRGLKFYTLISPESKILPSAQIGEAVVINGYSNVSTDVVIGTGCVLNGDIVVGHDSVIGDFNFFGPRSQVLGNVKIGNHNQIGANAVLLPKCKIGNNNKIAPLSAVYKGCRDNCHMQGNPALKE